MATPPADCFASTPRCSAMASRSGAPTHPTHPRRPTRPSEDLRLWGRYRGHQVAPTAPGPSPRNHAEDPCDRPVRAIMVACARRTRSRIDGVDHDRSPRMCSFRGLATGLTLLSVLGLSVVQAQRGEKAAPESKTLDGKVVTVRLLLGVG